MLARKVETQSLSVNTIRLAAPFPVKDLGRVFAVQSPDATTSLVRVTADGATCDCAYFTAHHSACDHTILAARFVRWAKRAGAP